MCYPIWNRFCYSKTQKKDKTSSELSPFRQLSDPHICPFRLVRASPTYKYQSLIYSITVGTHSFVASASTRVFGIGWLVQLLIWRYICLCVTGIAKVNVNRLRHPYPLLAAIPDCRLIRNMGRTRRLNLQSILLFYPLIRNCRPTTLSLSWRKGRGRNSWLSWRSPSCGVLMSTIEDVVVQINSSRIRVWPGEFDEFVEDIEFKFEFDRVSHALVCSLELV